MIKWNKAIRKRTQTCDNNWELTTYRYKNRDVFNIHGCNNHAGISGYGYSLEEAWESIINSCTLEMSMLQEVLDEVKEELNNE